MPTTLAATFQAGSALTPARVLLQVTGAPSLTPVYASAFTASVDGWTATTGTLAFGQGPSGIALRLTGTTTTAERLFSRTVTGLVVGNQYRYSLMAQTLFGQARLLVSGVVSGAFVQASGRAAMSIEFTATATSHVIQVGVKGGRDAGEMLIDTVRVQQVSGWQGTTIRRTDANGTSVIVREAAGGQDTTGASGSGVMTVTDYEAALVGTVSYTVTDGNGGTASASVAQQTAPGVWLTLPATSNPATPTAPSFVQAELVTRYAESSVSNGSVHRIVGRSDPIVNAGPLASREGDLSIWCADYAKADAVRSLLAAGDVAHLRQPDFAGLDLYLSAQGVSLAPEEDTRRWIATVRYIEVAAP